MRNRPRTGGLLAWPPLYPQAMALSSLFLAILLVVALLYQGYMIRIGNRATLNGDATAAAYSSAVIIF